MAHYCAIRLFMLNTTDQGLLTVRLNQRKWIDTGFIFDAGEVFRLSATGSGGWNAGDGNNNALNNRGAFPISHPEGTRAQDLNNDNPPTVQAFANGWSNVPYNQEALIPENARRTSATINTYGFIAPQCYPYSLIGVIKPDGQNPSLGANGEPTAFNIGRAFDSTNKGLTGGRLWVAFNEVNQNNGVNAWLNNYGTFQVIVSALNVQQFPLCPEIDDVELDREICREASGGLTGNTDVTSSGNAKEQRQVNWPGARRIWKVMWVARSDEQKFRSLMSFYQARRMRGYGFRFFDWADYDDWDNGIIQKVEETGVYQMFKVYPDLVRPIVRPIYKPLAETIQIFVNGIYEPNVQLDDDSGQVFFSYNVDGMTLTWTGQFCIPARFDSDEFFMNITPDKNVVWNGINVIELI